jgi:imidazoleglycerol-phosphate dehydratase
MSKNTPGVRYAEVDRETAGTSVRVVLDLDGGNRQDIATGIGFFDHMLETFAFHGNLNIGIQAEGDLVVDDHHTIEEVGVVLGRAIREALGSGTIERFASEHLASDDALVLCAIDVCGNGYLQYEVNFKREKIGDMATEAIRPFFHAICFHSGITLHIREISSFNDHHLCEAVFKAFGRVLHKATRPNEKRNTNSIKGAVD